MPRLRRLSGAVLGLRCVIQLHKPMPRAIGLAGGAAAVGAAACAAAPVLERAAANDITLSGAGELNLQKSGIATTDIAGLPPWVY